MEYGDKMSVLTNPEHPYTSALMKSIPPLHEDVNKLHVIRGDTVDLTNPPAGCRFHPRCDRATEICTRNSPELVKTELGSMVACFHPLQ